MQTFQINTLKLRTCEQPCITIKTRYIDGTNRISPHLPLKQLKVAPIGFFSRNEEIILQIGKEVWGTKCDDHAKPISATVT